MSPHSSSVARPVVSLLVGLACLTLAVTTAQAQPPIVQPGAPGEPSRLISAADASDLAGNGFTDADVKFLQGMISHHAQATEMTALLASRSTRDVMHRLGARIEISQADEIAMMQEWLREGGQTVTAPGAHHVAGQAPMPGMVSQADMERLSLAEGIDFDRMFLGLMITHHRGAVTMVENLLRQQGSAQDSRLYAFTTDVTADQNMEIDRMNGMLVELFPDPRVGLAGGFFDAEEAAWNMALVATRPKPDGFRDPDVPAGRAAPAEPEPAPDAADDKEPDEPARPGLLNFANTDLAVAGDMLFEGNYHGFNTYRVESPVSPQLVSSVVCPGGQGDVSLVGDLLIMSVEETRGRRDCGLQGVAERVSDARFRGIRIFDISDARMPTQVGAVQTCRGSHTHTVVTDPDEAGRIYVYGSGTGSVRPGEELAGCSDESPGEDPDTALFRIDVIEIPLSRPDEARIVSRPFVFKDAGSGAIAGLWAGGDHGPGTQTTSRTNQCHDITAYPEIGLAAGACSGNGILLDISDPVNPVRLDDVVDPGFAYWHSATFNNDGTKVIFTDEWGGGGRARCRASDPRDWGADAIYDIVDRTLQFRSHYKLPAPQTEQENCVAHNGSLVPIPGRDIFVQAWYQGGISVIDFTDSANPFEIAYFDRGPLDPDKLTMAGYWSAYWYRGFIYATEIARGLDVLELQPSEFLSRNELAAAAQVAPNAFNAQQQRRIDWSPRPVIARAYLDQLGRTDILSPDRLGAVSDLLDRTEQQLAEGGPAAPDLVEQLETAAAALQSDATSANLAHQPRLRGLSQTLTRLAERLQ